MKRAICVLLATFVLINNIAAVSAPPEIVSPSAILIERDTGKVLFQKDIHKQLPPASVTKVMTLLLVMEALDSGKISLDEMVTVSEYAAGMGGSQVFLAPGEQMSVNDMLKSTVISSGNDSAVALAEHIAGSEASFVGMMNERARQLGMTDTEFKNCTGLDTDGHLTSANDISLMSKELIKHEKIKDYTTIWMDSIRGGAFQLANTNKLIRTYKGITGLKTGSTSVAKFCLSATAERDGMELIAVIMAAPSGKERFADASKLLDFGFANYTVYNGTHDIEPAPVTVILGEKENVIPDYADTPSVLVEKEKLSGITSIVEIPEDINAPVEQGQKIGNIKITCGEEVIAEVPVVASESVKRLNFSGILSKLISISLMA